MTLTDRVVLTKRIAVTGGDAAHLMHASSGGDLCKAGKKTHEQQKQILEGKPDVPTRRTEGELQHSAPDDVAHTAKRDIRQSEFPISHRGVHQESDHNKHNDPPRGAPKHDGSAECKD